MDFFLFLPMNLVKNFGTVEEVCKYIKAYKLFQFIPYFSGWEDLATIQNLNLCVYLVD